MSTAILKKKKEDLNLGKGVFFTMVICIISNTIIFVGTETEGSSKERNFANIKKGRSRYICYIVLILFHTNSERCLVILF